ncbi:MAG: redoxin domain-containing protein [Halobacteria archaeon]
MNINKPLGLVLVLGLVAGGIVYIELSKPDRVNTEHQDVEVGVDNNGTERVMEKEGKYRKAKEISNPSGFVNVDNFSISENIGKKVMLVDFWTYSCVNCQRTLPYLNAWYDKYKDEGFTVVGVHAPEFGFEEKHSNVVNATERYGIEYPVVQDNSFSTWNAYDNRYWPQKYLIGPDGFIRYEHIGEGGYEETEKMIKKLIREKSKIQGEPVPEDAKPSSGFVAPGSEEPEFSKVTTPEIYFGSGRNKLANGQSGEPGIQNLSVERNIDSDRLYLDGTWRFTEEYAQNLNPEAKIVLEYGAKDVNIVANASSPTEVEVKIDGEPIPERIAGDDVENGTITVKEDQLYDVVQDDEYARHKLELTVDGEGLEAYTFTFG